MINSIQEEQPASCFFNALYCEYRNLMLSLVQAYVDDPQACEDILQNAMLSLSGNQKRIEELPRSKQKAYILLAVRHACFDYLRKEKKISISDTPDAVLAGLLAESPELPETPFKAEAFFAAVRQLSMADQTLLIGHYIVGLNSGELAQFFGCTSGAARVRLHRARKRARELFSAMGLSLEDFLR